MKLAIRMHGHNNINAIQLQGFSVQSVSYRVIISSTVPQEAFILSTET